MTNSTIGVPGDNKGGELKHQCQQPHHQYRNQDLENAETENLINQMAIQRNEKQTEWNNCKKETESLTKEPKQVKQHRLRHPSELNQQNNHQQQKVHPTKQPKAAKGHHHKIARTVYFKISLIPIPIKARQ